MAQTKRADDRSFEPTSANIRAHYSEFKKNLLERREDIINRTQVARRNLDEQFVSSPGDEADISVNDSNADYFLKLANTHQRELKEIDSALDRLQKGTYGECENCENPISIERLRKLPYARFCVDCQSAQEKHSPLRIVPR